jgi:hypothetical protein
MRYRETRSTGGLIPNWLILRCFAFFLCISVVQLGGTHLARLVIVISNKQGSKAGTPPKTSGHPLPVLTILPASPGRGDSTQFHGKLVQMH